MFDFAKCESDNKLIQNTARNLLKPVTLNDLPEESRSLYATCRQCYQQGRIQQTYYKKYMYKVVQPSKTYIRLCPEHGKNYNAKEGTIVIPPLEVMPENLDLYSG